MRCRKNSEKFGDQYKKGIPIEVVPMAYVPTKTKIEEMYGGCAKIRMAIAKAVRGLYIFMVLRSKAWEARIYFYFSQGPIVTDNGNFILDWHFPDGLSNWGNINKQLKLIPGVVETGLFIDMTTKAFFGMPDGSVKEQSQIPLP